jgi:hypothetical protein
MILPLLIMYTCIYHLVNLNLGYTQILRQEKLSVDLRFPVAVERQLKLNILDSCTIQCTVEDSDLFFSLLFVSKINLTLNLQKLRKR